MSCSVMSDSVTPWTTPHPASLSITNSQNLIKLMFIYLVGDAIQVSHPVISSSSCFQSFPASESFLMSPFFTSGGQSIGASASASVITMNIQDWFSLGLTDLISSQSQGLFKSLLQHHSSKASILQPSAFFTVQLSHLYMTTRKTIALTKQTFVGKVMPFFFF